LTFLLLFYYQNSHSQTVLDSIYLQINLRNYDSAISISNKIIDNSNDNTKLGKVYFAIGFCYNRLKEPTNAIENYLKALHSKSNNSFKADVLNNSA